MGVLKLTRGKVTFSFLILISLLFSTLLFPPIFNKINKVEPWILGLPFVQFWIILVVVLVSVCLIVWYVTEDRRGELE